MVPLILGNYYLGLRVRGCFGSSHPEVKDCKLPDAKAIQRYMQSFREVIWGFPKIRGTFLGVPIIRTIVSGGLS